MIKNKEKIIQEKSEKIAEIVKNYVEEMDTLSGTDEFTIDNIEKLWGELDNNAKEICKEISREIIAQTNEKEMIRAKKRIQKKWNRIKEFTKNGKENHNNARRIGNKTDNTESSGQGIKRKIA